MVFLPNNSPITGRNHLPCCQRQSVPSLCQPSCTGKYQLEKALDHAICHEHSKTILFCISEGLQVLPEQPADLSAEVVNYTSILAKWSKTENAQATEYKIIYRELTSFDSHWRKSNGTPIEEKQEILIVSGNTTEKLIGPLKKSTMYEIKMIALNKFGESLPTNELRVVTHSPTSEEDNKSKDNDNSREKVVDDLDKPSDPSKVPNLRQCCSGKGVKNEACLKQLCEPFIIEPVEVEESIMCMRYVVF